MKPYYQQGGITIFHADCRDVLDEWEGLRTHSFDLLLTDPPYGIGSWSSTGGNSLSLEEADKTNAWDVRVDGELLWRLIGVAKYAIVWGGNYYADQLGAFRTPFIWDKQLPDGMHFAQAEIAWTNLDYSSCRLFSFGIACGDTKGQRVHPTQKPEELMIWCLNKTKNTRLVLDPFMGSGTTLVAAKRLGKQATGIEREERYCEIAVKRLSQGVLSEMFT